MASLTNFCQDARFLARCMRYRYRTERLQIETLMELRLRGATVLDIGANKGVYCYWMRKAVQAVGRVVAFDPQPEMCSAISDRAKRLRWDNLEILNVGLSDKEGLMDLSREKIGDGSASLEADRHRESDVFIPVQVTRLDALCENLISGLKYIKCDVEGHERQALRGGTEVLLRYRPIVQFESTVDDERTSDIFEMFRKMSYAGVMLLGNSYLPYKNPDRVPHYKFGLTGHRDFIFFPPEAVSTTIPRSLASRFPRA